jgi:hypothetical protein
MRRPKGTAVCTKRQGEFAGREIWLRTDRFAFRSRKVAGAALQYSDFVADLIFFLTPALRAAVFGALSSPGNSAQNVWF